MPRESPARRSSGLRPVPGEAAVREARRRLDAPAGRRPGLRVLPPPALRVVDVALAPGERLLDLLDAKARWALASGGLDHHVIAPGRVVGPARLRAALRALDPEVVVVHDRVWGPMLVPGLAHELGARVVLMEHGDALALAPAPARLWRACERHAHGQADAVLRSSGDTPRAFAAEALALERLVRRRPWMPVA